MNTKATAYFTPLSQLGILQITGDDAADFLQNMFTNDIKLLANNQSQLSGFCNAKGRLFAIFLLIRRCNGFQIILPKSMCGLLQQRLSMFVLRANVIITDISEELICLGLIQPLTNNIAGIELPSEDYHGSEINGNLAIKLPGNCQRYLVLAQPNQISELSNTLQQQKWQQTDPSTWQIVDIKAGLPTIFPESKEMFTPQQVNLDLIEGVSFDKGCYPGQEVVARLHYLGKASRRMFLARCKLTSDLPITGSPVADQEGNTCGHIVRMQSDANDTLILLLSLKLALAKQQLFINNSAISEYPSAFITNEK